MSRSAATDAPLPFPPRMPPAPVLAVVAAAPGSVAATTGNNGMSRWTTADSSFASAESVAAQQAPTPGRVMQRWKARRRHYHRLSLHATSSSSSSPSSSRQYFVRHDYHDHSNDVDGCCDEGDDDDDGAGERTCDDNDNDERAAARQCQQREGTSADKNEEPPRRRVLKCGGSPHDDNEEQGGVVHDDGERDGNSKSVRHRQLNSRGRRRRQGKESSSSSRASAACPFPVKLHDVLSAAETKGEDDVVCWMPHGRAFIVRHQKRFVDNVLPKHFKQTKLTSFQRQLNLYGFTRLTRDGPDRGAYYHELFLRGMPRLSRRMRRMKVKGTGRKGVSNPDEEPDFYSMTPVGVGATMAATRKKTSKTKDDVTKNEEDEDVHAEEKTAPARDQTEGKEHDGDDDGHHHNDNAGAETTTDQVNDNRAFSTTGPRLHRTHTAAKVVAAMSGASMPCGDGHEEPCEPDTSALTGTICVAPSASSPPARSTASPAPLPSSSRRLPWLPPPTSFPKSALVKPASTAAAADEPHGDGDGNGNGNGGVAAVATTTRTAPSSTSCKATALTPLSGGVRVGVGGSTELRRARWKKTRPSSPSSSGSSLPSSSLPSVPLLPSAPWFVPPPRCHLPHMRTRMDGWKRTTMTTTSSLAMGRRIMDATEVPCSDAAAAAAAATVSAAVAAAPSYSLLLRNQLLPLGLNDKKEERMPNDNDDIVVNRSSENLHNSGAAGSTAAIANHRRVPHAAVTQDGEESQHSSVLRPSAVVTSDRRVALAPGGNSDETVELGRSDCRFERPLSNFDDLSWLPSMSDHDEDGEDGRESAGEKPNRVDRFHAATIASMTTPQPPSSFVYSRYHPNSRTRQTEGKFTSRTTTMASWSAEAPANGIVEPKGEAAATSIPVQIPNIIAADVDVDASRSSSPAFKRRLSLTVAPPPFPPPLRAQTIPSVAPTFTPSSILNDGKIRWGGGEDGNKQRRRRHGHGPSHSIVESSKGDDDDGYDDGSLRRLWLRYAAADRLKHSLGFGGSGAVLRQQPAAGPDHRAMRALPRDEEEAEGGGGGGAAAAATDTCTTASSQRQRPQRQQERQQQPPKLSLLHFHFDPFAPCDRVERARFSDAPATTMNGLVGSCGSNSSSNNKNNDVSLRFQQGSDAPRTTPTWPPQQQDQECKPQQNVAVDTPGSDHIAAAAAAAATAIATPALQMMTTTAATTTMEAGCSTTVAAAAASSARMEQRLLRHQTSPTTSHWCEGSSDDNDEDEDDLLAAFRRAPSEDVFARGFFDGIGLSFDALDVEQGCECGEECSCEGFLCDDPSSVVTATAGVEGGGGGGNGRASPASSSTAENDDRHLGAVLEGVIGARKKRTGNGKM